MDQRNLLKAGGLFMAALLLIGLIVWNVNRSGQMESELFEELEEIAELDVELCPFDGRLTRTSRAVLFDFSDPLPAELADYPGRVMENMMDEMEDAQRFDRFSLYTLNPFGKTPKSLNAFCIPVTMKQIPSDIRRTLWGKDPEQHGNLPERYHRFAEVFERLWENERTLEASLQESMDVLRNQSGSSQGYSRIIENMEEIVMSELDRDSRRVRITILSDMLQNSPEFSHYGSSWDFERYLATRRSEPFDMEGVSFDVYFVQTCDSLEVARRRALQDFWSDYFDHFNASADFKLLRISGDGCSGTTAVPQSAAVRQDTARTPAPRRSAAQGSVRNQRQQQSAAQPGGRGQSPQRSAAEDLIDDLSAQLGGAAEPPARELAGAAERRVADAIEEAANRAGGTDYDALVGRLLDGEAGPDSAPRGEAERRVADAIEEAANRAGGTDYDALVGRLLDGGSGPDSAPRGGAARRVADAIEEAANRAGGTDFDALAGRLLGGGIGSDSARGGGAERAAAATECAAPKQRNSPPLNYPRRARGSADMSFSVELDRRGVPVDFELRDMQLDSRRHERDFRRSAEDYISKLRFDLQQDGNCTGGQTARIRVRFQ